jgi:hypothetical protein
LLYDRTEDWDNYQDTIEIVASYNYGVPWRAMQVLRWAPVRVDSIDRQELERLGGIVEVGLYFSGRSRCNRDFWRLIERRVARISQAVAEGAVAVAYEDSVYFCVDD